MSRVDASRIAVQKAADAGPELAMARAARVFVEGVVIVGKLEN
jgi:hypothetical protein